MQCCKLYIVYFDDIQKKKKKKYIFNVAHSKHKNIL